MSSRSNTAAASRILGVLSFWLGVMIFGIGLMGAYRLFGSAVAGYAELFVGAAGFAFVGVLGAFGYLIAEYILPRVAKEHAWRLYLLGCRIGISHGGWSVVSWHRSSSGRSAQKRVVEHRERIRRRDNGQLKGTQSTRSFVMQVQRAWIAGIGLVLAVVALGCQSEPEAQPADAKTKAVSESSNSYDGPPRPSKQEDFGETTGSEAHRTAEPQVSRNSKTRSETDKPSPVTEKASVAIADTPITALRNRRVLVIEGDRQSKFLVASLRERQLQVTVRSSERLFPRIGQLRQYGVVVLANVPRDDLRAHFTDEQIHLLVRYVHELGRGLILVGGPDSFAAGGWTNSELEEISPVVFDPDLAGLNISGALIFVLDGSRLPESVRWQRAAPREAMKITGNRDYFDVLYVDGTEKWMGGHDDDLPRLGAVREQLIQKIDAASMGNVVSLDSSLRKVLGVLSKVAVPVKRVVIVSDGSPAPPSAETVQILRESRVNVSAITSATSGNDTLKNVASQTGGRYFVVKNPAVLPRVCRSVARSIQVPHRYEATLDVNRATRHPIVEGIAEPLPSINGIMVTAAKNDATVILTASSSRLKRDLPLLAIREHGRGRIAVLTTDFGDRWARSWSETGNRRNCGKLLYQLVAWSMGSGHSTH